MCASPSIWIHSPKNPSLRTQIATRGSRRRLRTFTAVSRLLMITRPASSTPTVMGESCARPSAW
jgi:hypothetical protein